ncbi:MAG TPA: apolipoprotein N-acyltransferase [Nitrospinota bacterium]|nr:apolipoprotein N-acyltransferase [Nitrospinota bacterium]
MRKKEIIYSIISGLLLISTFPKFNLGFLSWVALVPLFTALRDKGPLQSLGLAWVTGLIYFSGILYWVVNTMVNYGDLSIFFSYLILLMLVIYLSFYIALFGFFLGYLNEEEEYKKWIIAPFLWTFLEYLRSHILTGFPWASLGYSQFQNLKIIQFSDITGIYGISFFIVLVNSLLFLFIVNLQKRSVLISNDRRYIPSNTKIVLVLILSFSLSIIYGYLKIDRYSKLEKMDVDRLKVSLIQGNIEQDRKWDSKYVRETIDIYKNLTLDASKNRPDLIVWPETAVPFYFQSEKQFSSEILSLAKDSQSPILFGSPAYKYIKNQIRLYNRAYLVSSDERVLGKYDKIHLVPFGEYVPLKSLFPFINKIVEGIIGDFYSGEDYSIMDVSGKRFGILICFEIIFPQYARKFVKKGAQFLVNITNDAWFGKSAAPYQHIAIAVFRAIENRVFIVRAANTGISGFIIPTGKIVKDTEIFVRTLVEGEVIPRDENLTFYSKYGDIFIYFCIIIILAFFSKTLILRYKKRKKLFINL